MYGANLPIVPNILPVDLVLENGDFTEGKVIKEDMHCYLFALRICNFSSVLLRYGFSSNCMFFMINLGKYTY